LFGVEVIGYVFVELVCDFEFIKVLVWEDVDVNVFGYVVVCELGIIVVWVLEVLGVFDFDGIIGKDCVVVVVDVICCTSHG